MNKMKIYTVHQKPDCTLTENSSEIFHICLPHSSLTILHPEENTVQAPSQCTTWHNLLQWEQQDSLMLQASEHISRADYLKAQCRTAFITGCSGGSLCLHQVPRPAFHNLSILEFAKLLTFFTVSSCTFNGTSDFQYYPSFKLNRAMEN